MSTGYTVKQAEKVKTQIARDIATIEDRMGILGRRVTDHSIDGGGGWFGAVILEEVRVRGFQLEEIVDRRTRAH